MITLYSYPELFGVADNNPYGLKIFAFLKLSNLEFTHQHIFDAKAAPRGQLPYIADDGVTVGDSDAIIAHVTAKYALTMDSRLTDAQRTTICVRSFPAARSMSSGRGASLALLERSVSATEEGGFWYRPSDRLGRKRSVA
jgi:hypothetical protein